MEPSLIEADHVSMSFGPTRALRGVSFDVRAGEIHALAGENGAGKSTLVKILSGVHGDFEGSLRIAGRAARLRGPRDARAAGVATIHQELSLVGSMSVADNLFLGREVMGRLGVDRAAQRSRATALLGRLRLDVDPDAPVEALPIASQQLVEIGKALCEDARVLILDEPTSALDDAEAELLFEIVRGLVRGGAGVVYISHRMEELYALADRITVLRDGERVGTRAPADLPRDELVRWMVGRDVARGGSRREAVSAGPPALAFEGICVDAADGRREVDDVSFAVRAGEICGVAGLRGSGTTELVHAAFGSLGSRARGYVTLGGERAKVLDPAGSLLRGLVLLTSDRRRFGVVPDMGPIENATLASLRRFSPFGWIRRDRERSAVQALADRFSLDLPAPDVPVSALSGGGQQKTYLMRCLLCEPRALLLDEPTRGVDVAAKADIHAALRDLAASGAAIVLLSSDLEELEELADRVVVLHAGKIVADLDRAEASREAVLAAAMGRGQGTS